MSKDNEKELEKVLDALTLKQRRFVEAYAGQAEGVAVEAARLAGYKGSYSVLGQVGAENLKKPKIQKALSILQQNDPLVWSRKDIQQFLSRVASGVELDGENPPKMSDRLKAADQLAKTQGAYLQKIEHAGVMKAQVQTSVNLEGLSKQELKSFLQLMDKVNDDDEDS